MLKSTTIVMAVLSIIFFADRAQAVDDLSFISMLQERFLLLEKRIVQDPTSLNLHDEYRTLAKQLGISAQHKRGIFAKIIHSSHSISPSSVPADPTMLSLSRNAQLEKVFKAAKASEAQGNWVEAEGAYLQMIEIAPDLLRVKLDLGLLYAKHGYNRNSKRLFEEVLISDPPEGVKNNVTKLLKDIEVGLEKNEINTIALLGFNSDSNGNSVSSSGNVLINDVLVPLTNNSVSQSDEQTFGYGALIHHYNFDFDRKNKLKSRWHTNISTYVSKQDELSELDIGLVSLKTGPKFLHAESGVEFGYNAGYSVVALDGNEYLDSFSNELYYNQPIFKTLLLNSAFAHEHRHFVNTLDNITISEKNGETYQAKIGLKYILNAQDVLSSGVTVRKEVTRFEKHDNNQYQLSLGVAHAFENGISASINSSYKLTKYDAPDPFISAAVTREDEEGVAGISLSKKIKLVTASVGYEYKNIDSNIENYEYSNHRVSTSLAYSF